MYGNFENRDFPEKQLGFLDRFTGLEESGKLSDLAFSRMGLSVGIALSLSRLFNIRKGSLWHRPDLGLVDTAFIIRNLPGSATQFQREIMEQIEKYEPRLHQVRVEYDKDSFLLGSFNLNIAGYLITGRKTNFTANFSSDGSAEVSCVGGRYV